MSELHQLLAQRVVELKSAKRVTIAVKIKDMLGEELLVTAEV